MTTLVINSGSVNTKYSLFDTDLELIKSGIFANEDKAKSPVEKIFEEIKFQPEKIGFRIVHGGEEFVQPVELNDEVIIKLAKYNKLAPLHNPFALERVNESKKFFPDSKLFGVFDTAFHSSLEKKVFLYPIPQKYYEENKIRRYGFHGISYEFIVDELNKLEPDASKVIICHLGGGSSITAVNDGKSVDTSMGFTPLEGLMMATRSGDIDSGVIYHLMDELGISSAEMAEMQNFKSGLLGVSGISKDMDKLVGSEDENAKLAIDMYIHRAQKYIGAYIAVLNGIDALVFTAGIGEGSDIVRKRICENLTYANVLIDSEKNTGRLNVTENLKISTDKSIPVWVIPTNEELQIARVIRNL